LILAMALALLRPGYFDPLLEPGWPRMLPLAAIGQMVIGFVLIQKIVNIKV
jgi:Flp pilus assembly protein TadB